MIEEIRVYLALRPAIAALKEEFRMKLSWSLVGQVAMTAAQGLNALGTFATTADAKFWIASGLALVQLVGAVAAHYSNPDGTPAQAAWEKGKK